MKLSNKRENRRWLLSIVVKTNLGMAQKKNLSYWMTGLTHEKAVFIRTTLFDFLFFFKKKCWQIYIEFIWMNRIIKNLDKSISKCMIEK
jgi:hypothetical protein